MNDMTQNQEEAIRVIEAIGTTNLVNKTKSRYNLHYKIRKQGFTLNTKTRIVFLYEKQPSKQVLRLKNEFNYMVQLSLFSIAD